jgi:uncharacterized Zn finger protein
MAELDVEHGVVLATVQGSRYTPYRVRIRGKVPSEHPCLRIEKAMASYPPRSPYTMVCSGHACNH